MEDPEVTVVTPHYLHHHYRTMADDLVTVVLVVVVVVADSFALMPAYLGIDCLNCLHKKHRIVDSSFGNYLPCR